MQWLTLSVFAIALLSALSAAANISPTADQASASPQPNKDADLSAPADAQVQASPKQQAHNSVFGAGCRWDPTTSNIEEVTFQFRTGQAPPSNWFSQVNVPAAADAAKTDANKLHRRQNGQEGDADAKKHMFGRAVEPRPASGPVLDASYHTPLIDVLTYRARYGSFGSSLNSAGCALPAFSERLAALEAQEGDIVNNYTKQHKPIAGPDDKPSAMFFWAGISNYDNQVRADLIQTVVFYGDGCAANPRQGLCIYAAEYNEFRYDSNDHMCMGSNMPVFYPIDQPMTVHYRTQAGFRTQEAWIDGKMVSYLRSAGDQVMNSFVITQECKGCEWPLSEQVYENITIKFSKPELDFDKLQSCSGGAGTSAPPRMMNGGKVWVIDRVTVPSGKHVKTASTDDSSNTKKQDQVDGTADMSGQGPADKGDNDSAGAADGKAGDPAGADTPAGQAPDKPEAPVDPSDPASPSGANPGSNPAAPQQQVKADIL
ncbi:uncharacterized protein UMAG_01977 [Mycosarcoma maydis]|uniref:Uncharacterized protein n=1 Tax=Mycosarcoma maydis TaxID=5270 RepID=A0A0D1E403_MYCMD|nr:uncharacterized protein UMAG_01977 [Ustilago maydis 521]KIS70829.1 hypothetical protein UMAG_01977 [Ustilago maydis 521]|eukprot:XP_011387891.1 hypothetical protein UMAG_01977 [Ustilago maydis 521]